MLGGVEKSKDKERGGGDEGRRKVRKEYLSQRK